MTEYAYDRGKRGRRRSYFDFYERNEEKTPERRGGKRKTVVTLAVLLTLAALIGLVLFGHFSSYFAIEKISVSGLMSHTEEEMISASGIEQGSKIYTLRLSKAKANILAEYPEIEDVRITKNFPSEVTIHVIYATPKYFICVTGEYFTLSGSLKVLERVKDRRECEGRGLTYLALGDIKRSVTGSELEFFSDAGYVKEILKAYENSYFAGDADKLYINSKFDISIVKTSKYFIKMGDFKDKELKLKMAEKVLLQDDYRDAEGVILDVSNVSETTVQIDKTQKIE